MLAAQPLPAPAHVAVAPKHAARAQDLRKLPRQRNFAHHPPAPLRVRPTDALQRPQRFPKHASRLRATARAHGEEALGVSVPKRRRHAVQGGHGRNGPGSYA